MKTIYILKLENKKYLNNLVRHQIRFIKIKEQGNTCFLYVDKINYQKIEKYFNLYNLSLVRIKGFLHYLNIVKKNSLFILCFLLGIGYLMILSNIIFDVKIMTNKEELIRILNNELDYYNLKKYHLIKSYEEKEKIKKKILDDYSDKFEWIEIERIGTKYYVHVLERIIHRQEEDVKYQDVVAKKNAVIKEIKASSGQIVKKVNDYVNVGETIISGNITKKDEIKKTVKATGSVYGETWYNIKVELPHTYNNVKYTGNIYKRLSINLFNKRFLLGKKKYQNELYQDYALLSNNLVPFSLNYTTIYEIQEDNLIYTYDEALNVGINKAREKLLETLDKECKILFQKKLKLYEENSKIIIEVFFKVYENITDYREIRGEGNDHNN